MTLANHVHVSGLYTRAVRLERTHSDDEVGSFIPTQKAAKTLARIAETFTQEDQPRAWSLVGPYGSGKSSFALYLSELCLGNPVALDCAHNSHAKKIVTRFRGKNILPILVTGSPEPLGRRLLQTLLATLAGDGYRKTSSKREITTHITKLLNRKELASSQVINAFEQSLAYVEKRSGEGLLLVIDELGKFLEYEARSYDANDIYLLQGLAELSFKGGNANFYLVVLLHRSIDQYAQGLGESLKQEWSKIQGRFEEVPYVEGVDQILQVVSAAIVQNFSNAEADKALGNVAKLARKLAKYTLIDSNLAGDLFKGCYPLHPLSALLLPQLCNKISQNERTLFSYLGSDEEFGFQHLLSQKDIGDYIYPWDVYDYFVSNQSSALGDHLTHRRWVEVVTAVERADTDEVDDIKLLKTIGLFNIVAAQGAFKASSELLLSTFSARKLGQSIDRLMQKSLVVHRKFNNEYRVWQGSDFDIDAALQQTIFDLGDYSISDELNRATSLNPVVARRHTVESGAMRYFLPVFIDAKTTAIMKQPSLDPRIFFYLGFDATDRSNFVKLKKETGNDVLVYCQSPAQLKSAVLEAVALRKIQTDSAELRQDPIATREFAERLRASQTIEKDILSELTSNTNANSWFFKVKKLKVSKPADVQIVLSQVLDEIFPLSPVFKNELINRDRPSAQAVSARTKLMEAMLQRSALEDFGFEKFPAEKSMYLALLKTTKLHRKFSGEFKLVAPPKSNEALCAVWSEITRFMESTESQAHSFIKLNNVLLAPPYGVKAGVLPILYLAYYLTNEHEIAVFESRRYRPVLTSDMLERFVKRPDDFTFQLFRISGLKASLFKQYSVALFGHEDAKSILEVAKPLAKFMSDLPDYTLKTRRGLSKTALALRSAFNFAKSPEHLVFEKLPEALGFSSFKQGEVTEEQLTEFAANLRGCLGELKGCYENLLGEQKAILAQALNLDPVEPISEVQNYAKHWYGLEKYTADGKELGGFITRLTKVQVEPKAWLENVLMFLVQKQPKDWLDGDRDEAEFRLHNLASRALELQKIKQEADKFGSSKEDYQFYFLKSLKQGEDDHDRVISISTAAEKRIAPVIEELREKLSDGLNQDLRLAILAKLTNELLVESKDKEDSLQKKRKRSNLRMVKEHE